MPWEQRGKAASAVQQRHFHSCFGTLTGPTETQGPRTQLSPNNPGENPLRLQQAPLVSRGLLPRHELVQL